MQDPDQMRIKWGGQSRALLGSLLFAMSITAIVKLARAMKGDPDMIPLFLIMMAVCSIVALVGAVLALFRLGVVLDRRGRVVKEWFGLFVPMKTTRYSFDEFRSVTISRVPRQKNGGTSAIFTLRLDGESKRIEIGSSQDYQAARHRAEEVAQFMELVVEDRSSATEEIVPVSVQNENSRDRTLFALSRTSLPVPPPNCGIRMDTVGDSVVFDLHGNTRQIPRTFFFVLGWLLLVLVICALYWPAWKSIPNIFHKGDLLSFLLFALVFGGVCIAPAVCVTILILRTAMARDRVVASSRSLRLESRSPFGNRFKEIPADKIKELVVARSDVIGSLILARSDSVKVEIGHGLPREELQWLRDTIHAVVTAPPP